MTPDSSTSRAAEPTDLLPCPFCGAGAYAGFFGATEARVKCLDTACGAEIGGYTMTVAVKNWNRRAKLSRAGSEPTDERAAFEEWAVRAHGRYTLTDPDAGSMWAAWKARAALSQASRAGSAEPFTVGAGCDMQRTCRDSGFCVGHCRAGSAESEAVEPDRAAIEGAIYTILRFFNSDCPPREETARVLAALASILVPSDAQPAAWQVAASFWQRRESIPEALQDQAVPLYTRPVSPQQGSAESEPLRAAPAIRWPKSKHAERVGDMGPEKLRVTLDNDNDVIVSTGNLLHSVEFCNGMGGGGRSPRTRAALINLMTAIEEDATLEASKGQT